MRKLINWLINNKEWVFSGIGITAITAGIAIIKMVTNKTSKEDRKIIQKQNKNINPMNLQGMDNSINTQIGNVNINMRSVSRMVLKFGQHKINLYYPERYLEKNSHKNIMNYNMIQQLVDEFKIILLNIGDEYFKNLKITFKIDKDDALVTDKNLLFISTSLPIESVNSKDDDKHYVQEIEIPTIEPNQQFELPLDKRMNGLIVSSIFNISHFISFTKKDFKSTSYNYLKKCKQVPLKAPRLYIDLEYKDLYNAIKRENMCIEFIIEYQQICSHFSIIIKEVFDK